MSDADAPPVTDPIAELIKNGLPPLPASRETEMRATAARIAEELVESYRTGNPTTDEQVPRLSHLFQLHPEGCGMDFAVEHLTTLRLRQPHGAPGDTAVVELSPGLVAADASPVQRERFDVTREIVTDIWTGKARNNPMRFQHGMTTFRNQQTEQSCDVVLLMARQIALLNADAS